ncbi:MBL fold metallo-hydrolase [Aeromicrobium panaciterrae]|uniref:MBL fold metallo-hydrolase n=1 Tax=Aeromicrobium panaciterrae TaxID=363861 RepID=UPI0031E476BE
MTHSRSPESAGTSQTWVEPGTYEVADGVHRIPLPLPVEALRAVNVYVIESELGLTLVDAGWDMPSARKQLKSSLRELGHDLRDVTQILVTHAHRDHYSMAVAIRREFGARISLGLGERPSVEAMIRGAERGSEHRGRLINGGADALLDFWDDWSASLAADAGEWDVPDTWLADDHPIVVGGRELQAISTPGHTAGHFVFADLRAGILFSGDHVLPSITPSIGYEQVSAPLPLGRFLESLAKIRALPDLRLLPAHGDSGGSSHARVDELLSHHAERLALCEAAVRRGASTAYATARTVPWTRHRRGFSELPPYNQVQAVLETTAHLEVLVARGDLAGTVVDGCATYATR